MGLVGAARLDCRVGVRQPRAYEGQGPLEAQHPGEGLGPVAEGVQGAAVQLAGTEPGAPGRLRDAGARLQPRGDRAHHRVRGLGAGPPVQGDVLQGRGRVGRFGDAFGEAADPGAGPQRGERHPEIAQFVGAHAQQGGGGARGEADSGPAAAGAGGGRGAGVRPGDEEALTAPEQVHAAVGQHRMGRARLHGQGPHPRAVQSRRALFVAVAHATSLVHGYGSERNRLRGRSWRH